MQNWVPIKKVLAGFIAAGITFAAVQLGVDVGDQDVKQAALAFAGVVVAYFVKS